MGFLRPKNFPIRKMDDNKQQIGRIYNPLRFPDHGGFTSASKLPGAGPFNVEAPEKGMRSGESTGKTTQD
jgi:hypothetical protein